MIPLAVPNLSGNEEKYLRECIRTNYVSSVGPFVSRFEEMVKDASGSAFCAATSSGTTGLHLALITSGVSNGDLVILPSFSFIASANAVAHCGATPWLFDVNVSSWTLDSNLLLNELKTKTERRGRNIFHVPTGLRVAAIMPVYTLGTPSDMDEIQDIANDYNLPIIADAAAAIGARYKERNLGYLADLSVFSFNGNKTVTSGGGGAVVSPNKKLIERVYHLSTTARVGTEYHHDEVGYNYRMTNIQAAVGCAQLEQLDQFVRIKRRIRATYDKAFSNLPGVELIPQPDWAQSACWFSGVLIKDPKLPNSSSFCEMLNREGIGARKFWKPIHLQPPYKKAPCTRQATTDQVWNQILMLPCSTSLTEGQQEKTISLVKKGLKTC